ncbi:ribonuclease HII [Halobacillus shinanisalinarum]|uniref:Ribonuclease HII n=1 Tax=Halobacillus shinanisalinarum TaxID=2932258 RepID=A0ABY4GYR8_9BACI|nr:ribonuclease HII [Halobacillus shinanisalinarum]UOQ93204.1 ribonuclease HII [Halobacillus shinanisalinarum]
MKESTIKDIKYKLDTDQFSNAELELLREDKRKGVHKLLKQYDVMQQRKKELKKQYERMLSFEKKAKSSGKILIAGIDEAGRGPLAGPVVAAAVILPPTFYLEGLYDSKQLSLQKREQFFEAIKQQADYGVGIVTNDEIDKWNIYQATKLAMRRAVNQLSEAPDHLLIDAMRLENVPFTQESIVKGDQRSVSIAAASIMAKVTRDRMMKEISQHYPTYGFASNQGYGTPMHLQALNTYGPTPYHRKSFAPVKDIIFS